MVNEKRYLIFWIGVLILSIFMAVSCQKEPIYDPNCGVVTLNEQVGDVYIVAYRWNSGEKDTIIWPFDVVSLPGDTVCKLLQVDLNELNCKP